MKLFVQGFPKDFDETDLREMFQLYGEVTLVKIIEDRATGHSKGFGFVTMPNKMEAMETMSLFRNTKIKGKQMVVQEAQETPNNRNGNGYNKW